MNKIQTQYVSPDVIDSLALRELTKLWSRYGSNMPFNAEMLLELEYDVQVIPIKGLKLHEVDCSLSRDGSTVYVDADDYENDTLSGRLLFSFAHELGHKILHEVYVGNASSLTPKQLEWVETQANMFAAHFLMPRPILIGVIASEVLERFDSIATANLSLEACIDFRIQNLANYFGVSAAAMRNRVKNIRIEQVLQGPYISLDDKNRFKELANSVEKTSINQWSASSAVLSAPTLSD